jgi:hypothetical protein
MAEEEEGGQDRHHPTIRSKRRGVEAVWDL